MAWRDAFVYVLVEHQSDTDPLMPVRMLRYVVRIWDQYLAEHPGAVRLPAVIPLVVHHNRRRWSGPTDVADLLDLDRGAADAAGECLPRLRFLLDDLACVDESALRGGWGAGPGWVRLHGHLFDRHCAASAGVSLLPIPDNYYADLVEVVQLTGDYPATAR